MKFIFIFFASIGLGVVVHAEEEVTVYKLSDGVSNYSIDHKKFFLGYSVYLLQDGLFIGKLQMTRSNYEATSPGSMNELLERSISTNQTQVESTKQAAVQNLSKLDATKSATPVPAQSTGSKPAEPATETFESCASRVLGLLKQKLRISNALSKTPMDVIQKKTLQLSQSAVLDQLQRDRSAEGFYCTSSAPALVHVAIPSDVEAIKALSALLVRKSDERIQLSRALALAYGTNVESSIRGSWGLFWRRLSLVAVFATGQPLPAEKQIIEELKSHTTHEDLVSDSALPDLRVRLTHDYAALDADYEKGLEFLRSTTNGQ